MDELIEAVMDGRCSDPFAVLGPHDGVVRAILPGATSVALVSPGDGQVIGHMQAGSAIFTAALPAGTPYRLRIDWDGVTQETDDPYRFGPLLSEFDLYLIGAGRHHTLSQCLGAHVMAVEGVQGTRFAVWAPNASSVSVVGDFNSWDGRRHPMRLRQGFGVWELFIPGIQPGSIYKYEIRAAWGATLPLKADPFAWQGERAPSTGSIVADPAEMQWSDEEWMARRVERQRDDKPMSIYEVHAGSWMHKDGRAMSWDELAEKLVPYAVDMGFTHVEFLPIMLHPFGGSWGYQPLGQFAPSPEFGSPEAFGRLVDRCHAAGLGVILDWVPAHFPNDAHGLALFDGTHLYDHADPREGVHKDWDTLIYNLGRNEVRGFLFGSALHWLKIFHVDALRVDAVASMLYRDYSREAGQWIPNIHGGRENLESVSFLRQLSEMVAEVTPGALLIAEESTAWPGVTAPAAEGGLGFTFKWNMGWMHDTLNYIEEDPINRAWHHGEMTFGMVYAYSEKFVLPISHDEVVHGKGSLLGKMPGDQWQRFANLRAYLGFMWTHPGKKLLFMGCEFGQEREWNHDASLDWHLLDDPMHRGVQRSVRDLNRLLHAEPALYARDCAPEGFRWVLEDDRIDSVLAFLRLDGEGHAVLVVCNFTPVPRKGFRVGVPHTGRWLECFNSDASVYGGSGMGNEGAADAEPQTWNGLPASLMLTLPPLSTLVFRMETPA